MTFIILKKQYSRTKDKKAKYKDKVCLKRLDTNRFITVACGKNSYINFLSKIKIKYLKQ